MRRLRRTFLSVCVLVLLSYGLIDDLRTQSRLHGREVSLTSTNSVQATTTRLFEETQQLLAATTQQRNADESELDQLSARLAADQQRLGQAKQGLALANLNKATLNSCLAGVTQAVGDLQASNQQAAIGAISAVAGPCESLEGSSPGGPVYPFDFPDPDVIYAGGEYFAYGTNAAGGNIQIIESANLSSWTTVGNALPKLAVWASPGATWAPGVFKLKGTYLLYYAAFDGRQECVSVAKAPRPEGPFVDSTAAPLECQASMGGSIDPSPYTDASGNPFLTWKSNGGSGRPATIWAQALSGSGTSFAPGSVPSVLLQPSQAWEGSVVEAPDMWLDDGTYYLFYSGNNWETSSYAEGLAVCQGPIGPCSKPLGNALYGWQPNFAGPGGGSVFTDASGNPWVAFHAWLPGAIGYPNARLLFVRQLNLSSGLPQVGAPG